MKESSPSVKRRARPEDVAIGQKLRALRLDRGLSQSALASMAGVSFQQLQKYESGANRISAGRLARVAAALHVPVTAFYGTAGARKSDRGFAYLRSAGARSPRRWQVGSGCRPPDFAPLIRATVPSA